MKWLRNKNHQALNMPLVVLFIACIASAGLLGVGYADVDDSDGDGVPDSVDNCTDKINADQRDSNYPGDDHAGMEGYQHYGNACDTDYDNNGFVGLEDFNQLRTCFGQPATDGCADVDCDGNGFVGLEDFNCLRTYFGSLAGPGYETDTGPYDLPGSGSEEIDPQTGGTIITQDGVQLVLPPDSFDQSTVISIIPVKVDNVSDALLGGVRFEPEGLIMNSPLKLRYPLPADWDGDVLPDVYEFDGSDPSEIYGPVMSSTLTGSPGAYVAEVDVHHFSGVCFGNEVSSTNCHSGTIKRMLGNFTSRGCNTDIIAEAVYDLFQKEIDFTQCQTADKNSIQAILNTYFEKFREWNGNTQIRPEDITAIKKAYDEGKQVVFTFAKDNWIKDPANKQFYSNLIHSAILRKEGNQYYLVHTPSLPHSKWDIVKKEYDGNEIMLKSKLDELESDRKLKAGGLVEAAICERFGQLDPGTDPPENYRYCLAHWYKNLFGKNFFETPYEERQEANWNAVQVYIEDRDKLTADIVIDKSDGTQYTQEIDFPGCPRAGFSSGKPAMMGSFLATPESDGKIEDLLYNTNVPYLSLIDFDRAKVFYITREIMSQVTHEPVLFYSETGAGLTFEESGSNLGDRMKGSYALNLTGKKKMPDGTTRTLTGTINGLFDGVLRHKNLGVMPDITCELDYVYYKYGGIIPPEVPPSERFVQLSFSGDPEYPFITWKVGTQGKVNASEIHIAYDYSTKYRVVSDGDPMGSIPSGIQYGDYSQPNTDIGPGVYILPAPPLMMTDFDQCCDQYDYEVTLKVPYQVSEDPPQTVMRSWSYILNMYGYGDPTCNP